MVSATIEQDQHTTTIIYPLTAKEARELTYNINSQAEQLRQNLLRFYDGRGWIALGYDSFKAWAIAEFRFGFQHAYTLMRVARVENDLSIIEGETVNVPINIGKQLSTLPTVELQLEALKVAETHAATAGREATEKDAIKAVRIVEKRELLRTSPYRVVAQMVNEDTISAKDGERITKWLNQSPPQTQVYVQEKMALGLTNMQILHKIVNRHREYVRTGEISLNLAEIDRTERICGVPFDRATEKDWIRMAEQNKQQHISDALLAKQLELEEQAKLANEQGIEFEPEPIVEPKAMNAYTNSPEKTLEALKRVLDDKTLRGLAELIMSEQGYVQSSTQVTHWHESEPSQITDTNIRVTSFHRNSLECKSGDRLELWMKVKR